MKEALELGLQLTSVLGYLHSHQPPIIFRDLKPSNVIRTPQGQVYLIDFGIARLFKPGQARDTIAFGSPGYAAPEQYGKAQTTPRSDVFSLGALLHHLLTGVDPSETPFRFKPLTKHHPAGLSILIERMVDLDVERRPATMELIRRDLERMLNDHASWHDGADDQVLPGAYITPASTQATGASPRVTFAGSSWQGAPSAWPNQNTIQPFQAGPVLQPTSASRKGKKGWGGLVVLAVVIGFSILSAISRNNNDTPSDQPVVSVPVYTLSWSRDGSEIVSGGDDGQIEIWDATSGQQQTVFSADLGVINMLAWSPDNQYIAAAGSGGQIQIWRSDGSHVTGYHFGSSSINALSWSPDSKRLALASNDGTMWVVDALTGSNSWSYQIGSESVTTVAWSPNGKDIAAGGGDTIVQVLDSTTKKAVYSYTNQWAIEAVSWSPDSKRMASTDSAGQVEVWDALTGNNLFTYTDMNNYSADGAIAWSLDGDYLASNDLSNAVEVWAPGSNNPTYTYTGHSASISALAWSPESLRIASASSDGTVQVWDALTGANVVTYQQT